MNKERIKGFAAGALTAALVGVLAVPGLSASTAKQLEAYYTGIEIYVGADKLEPTDANGNSVEPFIVDGTTYLPVRAVAQAVGYDVYYESKYNAVFLVDPDAATASPPPTAEVFDYTLQSSLLTRVNACISSANSMATIAQNRINDAVSRGMGRSSLADEYREALSDINADLANLAAIKTDIQIATTNDELGLYEYEIESYEAVY